MATIGEWFQRVNSKVLQDLEAKEAEIMKRERGAHATLAECQQERIEVSKQRESVKEATRLQLAVIEQAYPDNDVNDDPLADRPRPSAADAFTIASQRASSDPISKEVQAKARIGAQRYLILSALRAMNLQSIVDLYRKTKLSPRRIKDQLRSDLARRVVVVSEVSKDGLPVAVYSITELGRDLVDRFEAYRKEAGKPLPTRADANAEEIDELLGPAGKNEEATMRPH